MEIRLPVIEGDVETDDVSSLLSQYPKLYLICDRGFIRETIPALDSEGRAVCFTDHKDAAEYIQQIKDAQSRIVDAVKLTECALDWRYLGIEKFLLFTAKDTYTEHTRAELIGHREKNWLNSEFYHLWIRLKQARKYASAAKGFKKTDEEISRLKEKTRLLEYELHSYMSSKLLLVVPVFLPADHEGLNDRSIVLSGSAQDILAAKFGIYNDAELHIRGGETLCQPDPSDIPKGLSIACSKSEKGNSIAAFTDIEYMRPFFSPGRVYQWLMSFRDINRLMNDSLNSEVPIENICIDPYYMEYMLPRKAVENIFGVGVDNNIPKYIKNSGGKHIRINITGGKNNGCIS